MSCRNAGSSGWLVWNVNADYVHGAYKKADQ